MSSQAVADRAHVDAAILRRGAGIKKIQLEETVLGDGLGQRHAHDTARGVAIERDCDGTAIVDQHLEIAPRLVRADVVERQDELARRHVALRHRHENLAPSAEIGEAQAGEKTDIGDRYGRQQPNCARRSGGSRRRGRGCRGDIGKQSVSRHGGPDLRLRCAVECRRRRQAQGEHDTRGIHD
jgi:hypothetical protein